MSEFKAPWAVSFKEAQNDEIEYSVVRIDNDHGLQSWRWIEPDRKLIVACSRDSNYKYPQFLKDRLKVVAIDYAKHLNELEGQGDFNVMWHEEQKPPPTSEPDPLPPLTPEEIALTSSRIDVFTDILATRYPLYPTEPKDA